jgi:hypothetical protein
LAMSALTDPDEVALDYVMLAALRGDDITYEGPLDHACPLCAPDRSTEHNRTRPTLRTWKPGPGFITYYCPRCEAKGHARASASDMMQPRPKTVMPRPIKPSARSGDISGANRLWNAATPVLPASVKAYFRWRGIPLDDVPKGALRFHPQCPWRSAKTGCIVARFSDAATGEARGIWRRIPVVGVGIDAKPMTLGPMGGCVIRLYPEIGKRLVIAEGIETALAAATCLSYRGKPLHPVWATGCASNMKRFPVLDGVEQLIVLVDNDESGTGQVAAEECARRWRDAGREVVRLMPKTQGHDFNDLVKR